MWGKDEQFHSVFPLDIYENMFCLVISFLDCFIFKGIVLNSIE